MSYQRTPRRSVRARPLRRTARLRLTPRALLTLAGIFMLFTCSAPLAPAGVGGARLPISGAAQPQAADQAGQAAERPIARITSVPARPTLAQATASPSGQQLAAAIDRYLADLTAGGLFSGAVLVARGDEQILAKGYGLADAERSLPNTAETRYRLASLTKQFTAAAVLQLAQQGRLKLSDPICSYLDNCPAAWRPVIIRHLLNHTSGIVDYTDYVDFEATEGLPATPQQLVARFRDQPLAYEPGTLYDYCNSGYVLLGLIVERASGMGYPEYMRRAIFEPLGMSHSGYDAGEIYDPAQAAPYRSAGQRAGFLNATTLYSAGALYSTLGDLLLWQRALYEGRVVRRPLLDEMLTPGNGSYGYGLKIERPGGKLRISHAGNMTGVSNFVSRYPDEQLSIIVLSNQANVNAEAISDYIESLVSGG